MPRFRWFNIFGLINWAWQRTTARRQPRRTPIGIELLEARVVPSAGDLVPTFGTGGIVMTAMGTPAGRLNDMVLQPDGKIITAGTASYNTGAATREDFGLARFNPDGTLDTTFGIGGKVFTDVGGRDSIGGVALQLDGKIIAAGSTGSSGGGWAVARYNSDGSLDPTFGVGGIVISDLQPGDDGAYDVAVQPDGKIVVVGKSSPSASLSTSYFAVVRYNTNGLLDTSFGGGDGIVLTPDFGSFDAAASAVRLQPDGKILALGHSSTSGGNFFYAAARYDANGVLDAGFGTNGIVKVNAGLGNNGFEELRDAVLMPDGKIVIAGSVWNQSNSDGVLLRLTDAGQLDTSFGTGGLKIVSLGDTETIEGVAAQPNGKLVVAGSIGGRSWVGRFNANGTIDLPFGPTDTGIYIINHDLSGQDFYSSVLLMPNGDILAGGSTTQFVLARFESDVPVAVADPYSVNEDTLLDVAAAGVLGNDIPAVVGDTLTAQLVTTTIHGALTLNANGSFTYLPATNFSGVDGFTYRVFDGINLGNVATVTITVNAVADAPTISPINPTAYEGLAARLDVNAELFDTDGSESLSVVISGVPANVVLSAGTNMGGGNWALTPAQLVNLTISGPDDAVFWLTVRATATESSNANAITTTHDFIVYIQNVKPAAYIASPLLVAPPIIWDYSPAAFGAIDGPNDLLNIQSDQHFAERIVFPTATLVGGMDIYMSLDFAAVGQTGTVTFYKDDAGHPGNVLSQFTATVSVIDQKGALRDNQHRVHVEFPSPVALLGGTSYWVGMAGASDTWTQSGIANPYAPDDSRMAGFVGDAFVAFQSVAAGDMAFRLYGAIAEPAGISVNEGESVSLSGSNIDPGSDQFTYAWHVQASNGDVIPDALGQSFNFIPSSDGIYTVTLTVTDDDGGIGKEVVVVTANRIFRPTGVIPPTPGYDLPTFSWPSVAGAHHYGLRVIDAATNLTVFEQSNILSLTYNTLASQVLTPGHSYLWYVFNYSANGQLNSYSAPESFSLAPLAAPTQIGLNGSIAAGNGFDMPTFTWSAVAGADHYYVYVTDLTTNAVVIDNPNVAGTLYTATTGLTPGHNFRWLVAAVSTNGAVVSYLSAGQTFGLATLGAPTQISPTNILAAATGYDKPTFTWNAVNGADHYYVYVTDLTANTVVIDQPNFAGTSFTPTSALTPGHTFRWLVAAVSANGAALSYLPAGQTFSLAMLDMPSQTGPIGAIAAAAGYDKPTFTWSPVVGADHYYVYVTDLTTNIVVIDNPNVAGTLYTATTGLTPGHNFRWLVAAVSANGAALSYLPAGQTFSLAMLDMPSQTGPIGAIAAAAGYDKPTFTWSPVVGADHYYVYVTDLTTNIVVIDNPNVASTLYTATTGLTPGHNFRWLVAAVSANGAALSYLPAGQTFSLAMLDMPSQTGPIGAIAAAAGYDKPTFTWSPVVGADHYYVYVMDLTTNAVVIDNPNVAGTLYTATTGLTPGHNFRWLVAAVSANGAALSYLPAGQTFSLAMLPAPTMNGPTGTIAPNAGYDMPTFSWNASIAADHYWLYVVDSTMNKAVIDQRNLTSTSYLTPAIEALTPGHTFTWYVAAISADGVVDSYLPSGQTFGLATLDAPTQTSPTGTVAAAAGYDLPTFTWSAVAGANRYYLYVVDTNTGQAVINNPNVSATTFGATLPLTPGHGYTWYVGAISTNGLVNSYLPAGQTFRLAALDAPTQNGPNGAIVTTTPTFDWSAVAGAGYYYLYVVDTTLGVGVINIPSINALTFTPAFSLVRSHRYVWYVAAVSASGDLGAYLLSGVTFQVV